MLRDDDAFRRDGARLPAREVDREETARVARLVAHEEDASAIRKELRPLAGDPGQRELPGLARSRRQKDEVRSSSLRRRQNPLAVGGEVEGRALAEQNRR